MTNGTIARIALCLTVTSVPTIQTVAQDNGCSFIGNSACGGDDHGQCKPQERFYSERCGNGQVINKCFADDYCARTTIGRFNIAVGGGWSGGYIFRQLGDALTVTGGVHGPGNGSFIRADLISITWPQAHATITAAVRGPADRPNLLQWSNGTSWTR